MKAHLEYEESEALHVRLAEVLVQLQRYEEAAHHYHSALACVFPLLFVSFLKLCPDCLWVSVSPDLEQAKVGLERVEKALRGESGADDDFVEGDTAYEE